MTHRQEIDQTAEWRVDLRRLRAFWFGSRGFRPKLMRGGAIMGWPESPRKSPKKSLKKSDRMAARY